MNRTFQEAVMGAFVLVVRFGGATGSKESPQQHDATNGPRQRHSEATLIRLEHLFPFSATPLGSS